MSVRATKFSTSQMLPPKMVEHFIQRVRQGEGMEVGGVGSNIFNLPAPGQPSRIVTLIFTGKDTATGHISKFKR